MSENNQDETSETLMGITMARLDRSRPPNEVAGADLRKRWGGTDEAVIEGFGDADHAIARLGVTQEQLDQGGTFAAASRVDDLRDIGRGLRELPEDMTPSQARQEREDILSDPVRGREVIQGSPAVRRRWRALNALAARTES